MQRPVLRNYNKSVDKTTLQDPSKNIFLTQSCLSHHGHLECVDVEGSDLQVAADVVD